MNRVLLMLLLSVIKVQSVSHLPSCPASCMVCSEEAVICNRLAHIIDAPQTTQALLLTEGSISAVQPAALSELSNITVIGLSHNRISVLDAQSFRNLPFLHTLLLDHNLLTIQGLQGGALTNLTQLEVLALSNNRLISIHADVFKGTQALRTLKLEGNLITTLDSDSLSDFRVMESLDLSDNFIYYIDRNCFRGLLALRTLDLSRNRLRSAPAEAFSYLSWLTNLNLDLNSWNCSCQLLELAAFLSNFIQQPNMTLSNGRRMVCVSADNPAVTTVLELTEANCVPVNQKITGKIEARASVTPQRSGRDLAITGVICFSGGVGLTLLIVLIHRRVSRKKKLKERKSQEEKEQGSSTMGNHSRHKDERRQDIAQTNSSQLWEKETMMLDTRVENVGGPFRPRGEENGQFRCPECREVNPVRWDRMNGGVESLEDREKRRMRMMTEEERRRPVPPQGRDPSNRILPRGSGNYNFDPRREPRREPFNQRPETVLGFKTRKEMDSHEMFHCENCHRTYRPTELNTKHGNNPTNMRDSVPTDGFPYQNRLIDRGRSINYNEFEMGRNLGLRREIRNVQFDLQSSRSDQGGKIQPEDGKEEKLRSSTHKEGRGERKHKTKVQSSRLLKVKLNLNPLRKSKVHPGKSSPKKSKDKGKKAKKSSKSKGSCEDGEDREEGGQKSKTSSKQKKDKENIEQDQNQDQPQPASTQPGSAAAQFQGGGLPLGGAQFPFQHPFSLSAMDRNRTTNLSLLGSAGSQLPGSSLSLQGGNLLRNTVAPGANTLLPGGPANALAPGLAFSGANMAPGGAPGSLIMQTGLGLTSNATSLIANTVQSNPLHATALQAASQNVSQPPPDQLIRQTGGGPTSSITSLPANIVQNNSVQAKSMQAASQNASNPVPDQLIRQTGGGSTSSGASHQANTVQSNPVPAKAVNASSQPAEKASNVAAKPAVVPPAVQSPSQQPPDSSPRAATVKSKPIQGSGPQNGEEAKQQLSESQASQVKENISQPQAPLGADGSSAVFPQTSAPVTMIETLSNTNIQTELGRAPGDVTSQVVALTDGPTGGGSVSNTQTADMSVSGVSAAGGSADNGSATGLLQQEYLSEEAGSSPRRKLRLVLPEKTSSRMPTPLERKIR